MQRPCENSHRNALPEAEHVMSLSSAPKESCAQRSACFLAVARSRVALVGKGGTGADVGAGCARAGDGKGIPGAGAEGAGLGNVAGAFAGLVAVRGGGTVGSDAHPITAARSSPEASLDLGFGIGFPFIVAVATDQ